MLPTMQESSEDSLYSKFRHRMNKVYEDYTPAIMMSIGSCAFATMDMQAKYLIDIRGVPPAPILFARMSVTAIIAYLYMKHAGMEDPFLGPKGVRAWLLVRGIVGGFGVFMFYSGLHWLQLGDALSIWFTSPLMVGILSALFLAEPFTRFQWICAAISMCGVLLVTEPPFLFGSSSTDIVLPNQALGFFYAITATVFGSISFVVLRHTGSRAHPLFSVSYFGWCTAVVMLPVIILSPSQRPDLSSFDAIAVLALAGVSFMGWAATYLTNRAVQSAKAGRTTLLVYTQIPLVVLYGYFVFGDVMDIFSIAGCFVIVGSAVAVTLKKEKPEETKEGPEYTALSDRVSNDVEADGEGRSSIDDP